MAKIAITDYIESQDIEKEILCDLIGMKVTDDTEVLLVWHKNIDEEYIKEIPNLRGIQRYGVGYDNLDHDLLKSKGIVVCNNPDYGIDEVSNTAVAMILNIARGVSLYNVQAKKYFDTWQKNINHSVRRNSEIVVGVIGAGKIGGSVILKCNGLKFKTVFYDKYKERGHEKLLSSMRVNTLRELLNISDIISLHVPLREETKGMVNKKFLSEIKDSVSIINTARGGLIKDLDLLYDALKSNKISHLALDVLLDEPPKNGKLIDAWRKSEEWLNGRLIINPHTSYYSQESYKEMRIKAAENALRIYNGQEPYNKIY